jgi:hypothetical protein
MANITITIPDAMLPRVQAAVAADQGWQAQVPDPANPGQTIPNPETQVELVRRVLKNYLRTITVGYEAGQAQITEADKVKGEFGP